MNVKWEPQDKQRQALQSNANEILFGGARGGGKTDTGMVWLLYDIDNSAYRALVIRRNYTDLNDWIDRARDMYRGVGGKFVGDKFIFPSGAVIRTGHLADKDAYQKYQGHEYHKIVIEELTHISRESDYEKLLGSLRSTVKGITPQIFCTTNPDGAGHEWVKERWGIPDKPSGVVTTEIDGRKRVFIPSSVYDNAYLGTEYVDYLESIQDEELKRAWLDGSWEGFGVEGAYYKSQIERAERENRIGLKNIYDQYLSVHTWCDLGVADSFAIIYVQIAGKEARVIDVDEFEGESLHEAISRMRNKPYVYGEHYAPHDIEVRELGTGRTRRETAESLGVRYNTVPRLGIAEGIDALRLRFQDLYFDEKADLVVKRLKRYHKEFDEKRGVFKNKPAHDENSHIADAMRYFAVTKEFNNDDNLQKLQYNQGTRQRWSMK